MFVATAVVLVGETLLHEYHASATGGRLEGHSDLGLVPARAVIVVPAPGEDEAFRRLDGAVDAAHGAILAVGRVHCGAPAPAGAHIHRVFRRRETFGPPPFHQLFRLAPQREQTFGCS